MKSFGHIGLILCIVGVLGCTRTPITSFSRNDAIEGLSEIHQQDISAGLLRLFGTPNNPRLRKLDPEAEEPEDGNAAPLVDAMDSVHVEHGARVYNARCSGCHGITGDGAGAAGQYLTPKPRDYRRGIFKFTSTPYGAKPARQDLVRTIRRGAKGTSMPAFPWMTDEDLDAVIDYVIFLSKRGQVESVVAVIAQEYEEDEHIEFVEFTIGLDDVSFTWTDATEKIVLPLSAEPAFNDDSITAGRKLFLSQACSSCHGTNGKGQIEWLNPEFLEAQKLLPESERVKINYDAWNEPAPAADLTSRMLHGGRRPIDIYRRIFTGINGTPMPAFGGVFAQEPEKIWHLVHYVRHVIEGGEPSAGIESFPPESPATDASESSGKPVDVTTEINADENSTDQEKSNVETPTQTSESSAERNSVDANKSR